MHRYVFQKHNHIQLVDIRRGVTSYDKHVNEDDSMAPYSISTGRVTPPAAPPGDEFVAGRAGREWPEGSEVIEWNAGFRTVLPFVGKIMNEV